MDNLVIEIEDETLRDSDAVVEIESDDNDVGVGVGVGDLQQYPRDMDLWTEGDWEMIFDEGRIWREGHPNWMDDFQQNHPTWRENLPDDVLRIIDDVEDDWGAQPEVGEWEYFDNPHVFDEASSTRTPSSPPAESGSAESESEFRPPSPPVMWGPRTPPIPPPRTPVTPPDLMTRPNRPLRPGEPQPVTPPALLSRRGVPEPRTPSPRERRTRRRLD